ncbi:MAG: hypothetical protein AAGF57_13415 [Pseudomonadota bacterium]
MKPLAALALMILVIPTVYAQSYAGPREGMPEFDEAEASEVIEAETSEEVMAPFAKPVLPGAAAEMDMIEPEGDTMLAVPPGDHPDDPCC